MMLTFAQRLHQLGTTLGEQTAIITVANDGSMESLSWASLVKRTGILAKRMLAANSPSPVVALSARSGVENICELVAVLRTGLVAFPFDPHLPQTERDRLFSAVHDSVARPITAAELLDESPSRKPDSLATPVGGGVLLLTGGSTGVPKPVLWPGPPGFDPVKGPPLLLQKTGWRTGQRHLVVGSLSHAAPLNHLIEGLLSGNTMVLPELFEPAAILDLIGRLRISWMQLTPTHMRILDPILREHPRALRDLNGVLHTAAPCPPDTKRVWLEAVGAAKLYEMYAATEDIGQTLCSGTEWLERPGTVGRGFLTKIRIYSDDGQRLPSGEVGTVYMKALPRAGRDVGRPSPGLAHRSRDGFHTVGDHGMLDRDGYLHLKGRGDDLVLVGGENVYTNYVTSVVLAHPGVADAAVIAEPDSVFGSKLVALVVPRSEAPPTEAEIFRHCLARLAVHQVPAEVRMMASLGRSASGKLPSASVGRQERSKDSAT